MRILVTGATGLIGNHVVQRLLKTGHDVTVISRNPEKLSETAKWSVNVTIKKLDLSALPDGNLFNYLSEPDVCIHLAWDNVRKQTDEQLQSQYPAIHEQFVKKLLEGGLRHLLVAGAILEYGLAEGELCETMEVEPHIAYGRAKVSLCKRLQQICDEFGATLQWARIGYVYGEHEQIASFFGFLQKAIDNNDEFFPMSDGQQIQDFLHVRKCAEYICKIASQKHVTGIINVCSGEGRPLIDRAREFAASQKSDIRLKPGVYPRRDWEPSCAWGSVEKLNLALSHAKE